MATLNTSTKLTCPHGGTVTIGPTNTRVTAEGLAALVEADAFPIIGCPWQIPAPPGTVPSPCVTVKWQTTDMRVKVNGKATLSDTNVGFCMNAQQAPQGPVAIANPQQKVKSQ